MVSPFTKCMYYLQLKESQQERLYWGKSIACQNAETKWTAPIGAATIQLVRARLRENHEMGQKDCNSLGQGVRKCGLDLIEMLYS